MLNIQFNTKVIMGIVIAVLIGLLFLQRSCYKNVDDTVVDIDTTYVKKDIPEVKGTFTDTIIFYDTIPLPVKEFVKLDSTRQVEEYASAIETRNYEQVFEDINMRIKVFAQTKGHLNKLAIPEYTIKEREVLVPQVTKTITKNKNDFGLGSQFAAPLSPEYPFSIIPTVTFKHKNSKLNWMGGYDIQLDRIMGGVIFVF